MHRSDANRAGDARSATGRAPGRRRRRRDVAVVASLYTSDTRLICVGAPKCARNNESWQPSINHGRIEVATDVTAHAARAPPPSGAGPPTEARIRIGARREFEAAEKNEKRRQDLLWGALVGRTIEGIMHSRPYKPEHDRPNLSVRVQRPMDEEPRKKKGSSAHRRG
ncbi:hypothetical protein EVAR_49896_1 [Eumeta japonica]|uniref:Uncharacterized protein n=1 Tax=Eumeta variegata TaxID=151549 RepID=A0A4C1Y3U4_EUMVA|nr:hypothetical protein EVAR_49896_1 [Eumeta japonica]